MKKSKTSDITVKMGGKGSLNYVKEHKSKGIFYCPNYDGKVFLIENVDKYKEAFFDSMQDLEEYLARKY